MRTSITIEDDVALAIDRLRRAEGRSLRVVVNELLRLGLGHRADAPGRAVPVRTRVVSLGGCRLPNVDNIAEVLAIGQVRHIGGLEGSAWAGQSEQRDEVS